jgi:tetratricopeptide (TPR) repeat protein
MVRILIICTFMLSVMSFTSQAQSASSEYTKGMSAYDAGDSKAAVKHYTEAISIQPDYAKAYHGRADAKLRMGDDAGAIQDYNKFLELEPSNGHGYYSRGKAKHDIGDNKGACMDWNKASQLGYSDSSHLIKKNCK